MTRGWQINGGGLVRVKFGGHISGTVGTDTHFVSGLYFTNLSELGLTTDSIDIIPKWRHGEIKPDDYGPDIPAELMAYLAEVRIKMTLIHFDRDVLDICIAESMGGQYSVDEGANPNPPGFPILPENQRLYSGGMYDGFAGSMIAAGSLIGNGLPLFASGCHFISLNLESPIGNYPWRFPFSTLAEYPIQYPIGSKASEVILNWRAIPYQSPINWTNAPVLPDVPVGGYLTDPSLDVGQALSGGVEVRSALAPLWDHLPDY